MRVAFRADAGLAIGSGHVMRCLTLADAVAEAGGTCLFLTRPHEGHLSKMLQDRGYEVAQLTLPDNAGYGAHANPPPHAQWLGGDWRQDAAESRTVLEAFQPDWLALDHYALDEAWEHAALPSGVRLIVIDDLADRPHCADLLLDQNFGREASDYDGLLSANCDRLIGPGYALLRPEFAKMRPKALARRKGAVPRHLLITLGGTDKGNVTGKLLETLARLDLPETFHITVVMGANAPWCDTVMAQTAAMPRPIRVLTNVSNMAELMTEADICIGAVGGTTWERCTLGLPSILVVLAENQRPAAEALDKAEICVLIEDVEELSNALEQLCEANSYKEYVAQSASLTDGGGVNAIQDALHADRLWLRGATLADAEDVWRWRHEGEAWRYFKSACPVPLENHMDWFSTALTNPKLRLFIALQDLKPVGYVRLDKVENGAEVSICIAQNTRGQGLGRRVLAAAIIKARDMALSTLSAVVHQDNEASRRLFSHMGFVEAGQADKFLQLEHVLNRDSGDSGCA